MVDKVVLDLELNDEPLQRIEEGSKRLFKEWKDLVDLQKQWTGGFDESAQKIHKVNEAHERMQTRGGDPMAKASEVFKKQAESLEHGMEAGRKIFEHMSKTSELFKPGGGMFGLLEVVRFLRTPAGAAGMGLGVLAAGISALMEMSHSVTEEVKRSRGEGSPNLATSRSMGVFGAIGDPSAMIRGIANAREGWGKEDDAMRYLFRNQKGGAEEELKKPEPQITLDVMREIQKDLAGLNEKQRMDRAEDYGFNKMTGGYDTVRNIMKTDLGPMQKEVDDALASIARWKDPLDKAATDFQTLDGNLGKLATELSNATTVVVDRFVPALSKIIEMITPKTPAQAEGAVVGAAVGATAVGTTAAVIGGRIAAREGAGFAGRWMARGIAGVGGGIAGGIVGGLIGEQVAQWVIDNPETAKDIGIAPDIVARKKQHEAILKGLQRHPEGEQPEGPPDGSPDALPTLHQLTQSNINVTGAGHADWTPGPSYAAMGASGDPSFTTWMKNWFQSETVATKDAANAARMRDTEITQLLNWLIQKGDRQEQVEGELKSLIEAVDRHLTLMEDMGNKGGSGDDGGAPGPGGDAPGAPDSIRARGRISGQTGRVGGDGVGGGSGPHSRSSSSPGGQQRGEGGGESNTINPTPEITQLPGDKSWGDYGTRANNPGNLNWASWEGAASKFKYTDPQTHGEHTMGVFKTMPEGVAAAYKLMVRNQAKYGKTLGGALHGWAENSYIGSLAKEMGVGENDALDISGADADKVATLLQGQFRREGHKGSHTATREQILSGISIGRGGPIPGGGSSGGAGASGSWDAVGAGAGGGGAGSSLTTDYSGVTLMGSKGAAEPVAGGATMQGTVDFARFLQKNDPNFQSVSAFNDETHTGYQADSSPHRSGRAADVITKDLAASQQLAMDEFKKAGLTASFKHDGDVWIEPASMSNSHLHYQFETKEAADKYEAYVKNMKMAQAAKTVSTKKDADQAPQTAPAAAASAPIGGHGFLAEARRQREASDKMAAELQTLTPDQKKQLLGGLSPTEPPGWSDSGTGRDRLLHRSEMRKHTDSLGGGDAAQPRADKGPSGHASRDDGHGPLSISSPKGWQDPSRLGHKIRIDSSIGSDVAVSALTMTG